MSRLRNALDRLKTQESTSADTDAPASEVASPETSLVEMSSTEAPPAEESSLESAASESTANGDAHSIRSDDTVSAPDFQSIREAMARIKKAGESPAGESPAVADEIEAASKPAGKPSSEAITPPAPASASAVDKPAEPYRGTIDFDDESGSKNAARLRATMDWSGPSTDSAPDEVEPVDDSAQQAEPAAETEPPVVEVDRPEDPSRDQVPDELRSTSDWSGPKTNVRATLDWIKTEQSGGEEASEQTSPEPPEELNDTDPTGDEESSFTVGSGAESASPDLAADVALPAEEPSTTDAPPRPALNNPEWPAPAPTGLSPVTEPYVPYDPFGSSQEPELTSQHYTDEPPPVDPEPTPVAEAPAVEPPAEADTAEESPAESAAPDSLRATTFYGPPPVDRDPKPRTSQTISGRINEISQAADAPPRTPKTDAGRSILESLSQPSALPPQQTVASQLLSEGWNRAPEPEADSELETPAEEAETSSVVEPAPKAPTDEAPEEVAQEEPAGDAPVVEGPADFSPTIDPPPVSDPSEESPLDSVLDTSSRAAAELLPSLEDLAEDTDRFSANTLPTRTATEFEKAMMGRLADPTWGRQFDELADNIVGHFPNGAAGSLAIVTGGDGRRSAETCLHLGAVLAERSLGNVLLVDGDTELKTCSSLLEEKQKSGLVEALHRHPWLDSVVPTAIEHLHLLPAGRGAITSFGETASRLVSLLREAEHGYRFTIIDAGNIEHPFVQTIARQADATYLLVELGKSRAEQSTRRVTRLQAYGARVLGAIAVGGELHSPKE